MNYLLFYWLRCHVSNTSDVWINVTAEKLLSVFWHLVSMSQSNLPSSVKMQHIYFSILNTIFFLLWCCLFICLVGLATCFMFTITILHLLPHIYSGAHFNSQNHKFHLRLLVMLNGRLMNCCKRLRKLVA